MKKEQFNVRIPAELKSAAVTVAARLGWSNEEICKIALANLMGSQDDLVLAQRRLAMKVAKDLREIESLSKIIVEAARAVAGFTCAFAT
jgi:antitoxin component of RelBE/YafQ-DinJ toxin-antitoxin module